MDTFAQVLDLNRDGRITYQDIENYALRILVLLASKIGRRATPAELQHADTAAAEVQPGGGGEARGGQAPLQEVRREAAGLPDKKRGKSAGKWLGARTAARDVQVAEHGLRADDGRRASVDGHDGYGLRRPGDPAGFRAVDYKELARVRHLALLRHI